MTAPDETAVDPAWRLPTLRVDADGAWYDDDVEVTHHGVLANLRANLRRDREGYFIQTRVRIPVTVDDVPWVVIRIERRGDRLHAVLNDGSETVIDPATLRIGRGDVPYCAVKDGAFEARLSRAATFQLLALGEYDERTERGALHLGGRRYELSVRTLPGARHPRSKPTSPHPLR
jgi:hypothetical protein